MKNPLIIILMIFFSTISAIGCDFKKSRAESAEVKPVVCVINIDRTGSYQFLNKAKEITINIIKRLPDGSRVYVRWITEDSNSDRASIVSAIIPDTRRPKNPFDVKAKEMHKVLMAKKLHIQRQIINAINSAKSPMARRTDIYGALYAAGERFGNASDMPPLLILLSDMEDNVGNQYSINLKGADVRILGYQVSSKEEGRKRKWSEYLRSAGASNVRFSHIDEPLSFGGF
ncbi:MAG: hypothetical protein AB1480_09670 [Nitrospirota bacterium]